MSHPIPTVEHIDVTCFQCKNGFTWTHTGDYEFDPEHEKIACVGCAMKLGDHSMHWCLRCKAQYQSTLNTYRMGCSWECENWIDEQAERAQDRDLAREQAWLESYGGGRGVMAEFTPELRADLRKARRILRQYDEAEVRRLQKSWAEDKKKAK